MVIDPLSGGLKQIENDKKRGIIVVDNFIFNLKQFVLNFVDDKLP